jgi:pantoate--beta-alanine ligase
MKIVTKISDWKAIRCQFADKSIGFVPTMGHLHNGHMSLCMKSISNNDITVVSIFINPTQFNEANDFSSYPRTLEEDIALLSTKKVDYLFMPSYEEIYQDHYQIQIHETELCSVLEGEYRPGHFTGMLTVVLKLINIIQPKRAYFGEKDFQQLLLIKKMVSALFIPVEIIPCETIRATDGLALSSRNSRLNPEQRMKAVYFPKLLQRKISIEEIIIQLSDLGFKVDYIVEKWQRRLGAVWLDEIRLIDNFALESLANRT